jgi:hypothetical protein
MRFLFAVSVTLCSGVDIRYHFEDELKTLVQAIKHKEVSADNLFEEDVDRDSLARIVGIFDQEMEANTGFLKGGRFCKVTQSADPLFTLYELHKVLEKSDSNDRKKMCLARMASVAKQLLIRYPVDGEGRVASLIEELQPSEQRPDGSLVGRIDPDTLMTLYKARDAVMKIEGIREHPWDPEHHGEINKNGDPVVVLNTMLSGLRRSTTVAQKIWYLSEMGSLVKNVMSSTVGVTGRYRVTPEGRIQSVEDWEGRILRIIDEIPLSEEAPDGDLHGEISTGTLSQLYKARDAVMGIEGIGRYPRNPEDHEKISLEGDPAVVLKTLASRLHTSTTVEQKIWYLDQMGAVAKIVLASNDGNGRYSVTPAGEFKFVH